MVYEGDSRDTGVNPLDDVGEGSGTLLIEIPARVLGAGTYQIILSFASGLDPSGPEVDNVGLVGEFGLNDTKTPRGNRRRGYLSTIFSWRKGNAAA